MNVINDQRKYKYYLQNNDIFRPYQTNNVIYHCLEIDIIGKRKGKQLCQEEQNVCGM